MKPFARILTALVFLIIYIGCKKETPSGTVNPPPPPPPVDQKLVISNLVYSPDIVPIKSYEPTFAITGTIHFANAKKGLTKLKLTTSAGTDTTIAIPANPTITTGDLTGYFEFTRPEMPAQYSFDIWVIDSSGAASNKLSGTVSIIFDDRAVSWWSNSSVAYPAYIMHDVGWYNNQFIAVGGDFIETSKDGGKWTRQYTSDHAVAWVLLNAVTWTGSQYVAVGERNAILTSPDGSNWTIRNLGIVTDGHFVSVCSSGDLIVAVGTKYNYGYFSQDSAQIFISTDGINWRSDVHSDSTNWGVLETVIWNGNQFVAVGKGNGGDRDYAMILTSPDGMNWTDRSVHQLGPAPYNYISGLWGVVWTGSEFVAVGGVIAKSTDGVQWDVSRLPDGVSKLFGLLYDGKKFIAAGSTIYISNDAVTWTPVAGSPVDYELRRGIAWSGKTYVVVGCSQSSYQESP